MLNEAERHEPLTANAWNEQAARACIDEILSDAIDRFSARDLWPSHPLDSFSPDARWNLYIGAAGTIWALRHNDSVARGTRLNYFTNSSTLWCCGSKLNLPPSPAAPLFQGSRYSMTHLVIAPPRSKPTNRPKANFDSRKAWGLHASRTCRSRRFVRAVLVVVTWVSLLPPSSPMVTKCGKPMSAGWQCSECAPPGCAGAREVSGGQAYR
jgi:hypothetical protein